MNKAVFVDTMGLLAIWDKGDQWHRVATKSLGQLMNEDFQFFSTTFVMAECGNAAARRTFRHAAFEVQQQLEASGRLIFPTKVDWDEAWANYRRGEAGSAGIVDHVYFVIMRRLGIQRAFTNDQHFKAAGFEVMF